ncbi:uncharacterized protein Z519_07952 [Cladophialophora bantiana CBS 173.52]|uniref:Uncharacterized protein n=1 Tax=Cladophialophora bantiana (strain ATCC 10958 / CBS 173.52 / CDC B-1940 / NIH 8579) TaxID=1442370 RepID=A0A0D2HCS9_CLAB1|nr:uncharacterized protein Z519_07952 [Cladophialophora bantiana CBS 173.52]KIW91058.1 hypothetical protein Z519_07952 [Cladophialophora bantiana CBS 173.52]
MATPPLLPHTWKISYHLPATPISPDTVNAAFSAQTSLSGQDDLMCKARNMYTWLVLFDSSLCDPPHRSPDHCFSVPTAAIPLEKALVYPQYDSGSVFESASGNAALHELEMKYRMPENQLDAEFNQLLQSLGQQSLEFFEQVSRLVSTACNAFDQLRKDVPGMASEWRGCCAGLYTYLAKVEELPLRLIGPNRMSIKTLPRPPEEGSAPPASFSFRSFSDNPAGEKGLQQHDEIVGEEKYRQKAANCFSNGQALPCGPRDIVRSKPSKATAASLALCGWVYYGQVMAPSFSIYIRVFIKLVQLGGGEEMF